MFHLPQPVLLHYPIGIVGLPVESLDAASFRKAHGPWKSFFIHHGLSTETTSVMPVAPLAATFHTIVRKWMIFGTPHPCIQLSSFKM